MKVYGHTYIVRWPAGMDRIMENAVYDRINRSGAWQCKPGIMLLSVALRVAYEEQLAKAVSDV
ncbi:hypothetical protein LCGC14_0733990 [marine sediment metagenome]|uniref:Uncharacterized protein n=1 Tax=marine sediment metagenome TaxID=412755 RepID=A0A0F9QTL7_9ZZZZ